MCVQLCSSPKNNMCAIQCATLVLGSWFVRLVRSGPPGLIGRLHKQILGPAGPNLLLGSVGPCRQTAVGGFPLMFCSVEWPVEWPPHPKSFAAFKKRRKKKKKEERKEEEKEGKKEGGRRKRDRHGRHKRGGLRLRHIKPVSYYIVCVVQFECVWRLSQCRLVIDCARAATHPAGWLPHVS